MADLADKDAAVSHAINLIRAKVDHTEEGKGLKCLATGQLLVVFEVTLNRFGLSVML